MIAWRMGGAVLLKCIEHFNVIAITGSWNESRLQKVAQLDWDGRGKSTA